MDELRLQLLKRVQYIERSILLNQDSTLSERDLSLIMGKLKSLIEKGDIKSFLGVDVVFHYLEEKVNQGASDIDQVADEISNFVN